MSNLPRLGIILNPVAGRGRAIKFEKHFIEYLRQKKINFQLEKTDGPQHATSLSRQICKDVDIVIAVGGDGTANEVASGLIGSTTSFAIIPIGSGNDFNRIIGIPQSVDLAIETIIAGTNKVIDLGKATIKNSTGIPQVRYFLNVLGIGIDAAIAKETKRIKFFRGLPLYLIAAIKALSTYSPNEYNIIDGDTIRTEKTYLLCAGNGIYEGGGFKMLPAADPCESKLNICLIRKMPAWKSISIVPKIIKGTHGSHKLISMWQTMSLKVIGKDPFILHGDGEIFEENAKEVTIEIIPNAINIIVPKE